MMHLKIQLMNMWFHPPFNISFDLTHGLWISGWTRVLRFSLPILSNRPAATLVIGKPDFITPDIHPNGNNPSADLLYAATDIAFDPFWKYVYLRLQ